MVKKFFGKKCKPLAFAALFAAALFASCDFGFDDKTFQNGAAAYFKEMTNTAAITSYEISPTGAPTDKYGNICLPYDEDYKVTFFLRNPQHYGFNYGTTMSLDFGGGEGIKDGEAVTIVQDEDDSTKIYVTYPASFLKANPLAANISPLVTLRHPVSYASFGVYNSLKLSSDSPPPLPAGAIVMQTSDTPSRWVLCFNMPTIGMVRAYHSDIASVTINGETFNVSVNDGTIDFPGAQNLKTERDKPAGIVENQITGFKFEKNGQPCYFMTGDEADENERIYSMTITDNAGLSCDLDVSTKGLKLSAADAYSAEDTARQHPYAKGGNEQNVSNEKDDGTGEIRLAAVARTASGNAKTPQYDYDPSNATIIYEVYTDEACEHLLASGKIKGIDGVVSVPGGDSYIKAYVRKPLYSDSELSVWKSRVVRTAIYVASSSEGGSDSNDGSKNSPYATVAKAVEVFRAAVNNGDYGSDTSNVTLEVRVKGDLTGQPAVYLDFGMYSGTIKICGYEGTRSLASAADATMPAFMAPVGTRTVLEGLRISGGSSAVGVNANGLSLSMTDCEVSGFKSGLLVDNGSVSLNNTKISGNAAAGIYQNAGTVDCVNCEISGNGLNPGSEPLYCGVNVAVGTRFNMTGGSINGNRGAANGGGLIANGEVALDGVSMSGNTAGTCGGAVFLPSSGTLSVKGSCQIYGNTLYDGATASNVYITTGKLINVTGSVYGSKIGVCLQGAAPEIGSPVTFTQNYGAFNTAKPGAAFRSDTSLAVAFNNAGTEAAFALGGAGIYDAYDYAITFPVGTSVPAADLAITPADANGKYSIIQGEAKTFTIKPTVKRKESDGAWTRLYYNSADRMLYSDPTFMMSASDTPVDWTVGLMSGGSVAVDFSSALVPAADGAFQITVPSTVALGPYSLKISASFMGLSHDAEVPVSCGVEPPPPPEPVTLATPLTLEALGASTTVTFNNKATGPVTYKINGGSDNTIATGTEENITLGAGDKVAFYGGNTKYSTGNNESAASRISCDKPCYFYGNIMSLVDSENFETANTLEGEATFPYLFKQNEANDNLRSKDGADLFLPATTVKRYCYQHMFENCDGLTRAPELPAENLNSCNYCYDSMFKGCANLTAAPNLPATKLASYCYQSMFSGCSSLSALPEKLPAKELLDYSYGAMFYKCVSLKSIPSDFIAANDMSGTQGSCCYNMFAECANLESALFTLNSSHARKFCYAHMFENCKKLTTPPVIKTEMSDEYVFFRMFANCISLTSAPNLHGSIANKKCCSEMFIMEGENAALSQLESVPVDMLPATNCGYEECYRDMFKGCQKLKNAPNLPATKLYTSCYRGMFEGCSSLEASPSLPATQLKSGCYANMFKDCTSLKSAGDILATSMDSIYQCSQMFAGCVALTTPPKLTATSLGNYCYYEMFKGCASLQMSPVLPATSLPEGCYLSMFEGCSSLISVTCLATSLGTYATDDWLSGVAEHGTLYKAASMTSWPTDSASGIPSGWTAEDYVEP